MTFQSEERLPMNFTRLVEHVSKKQVPAHVTFFIVEVMASDDDGEDVEVPCQFTTRASLTALTSWIVAPIHYHPPQVI